ncbi:hypothetical protein PGT21_023180 [Puccinia graminis f. sp. tritici]|uniref:Uncharacterized protein n=1 Tax=Puccinia graminis f. sp. tritici TaxID=56615 RepID=A0A5B0LVM7_PUCGR|nr:hypothetical protein PGTUg99_027574 [Puccinia graminis f. sp. tritici]KAA1104429.1 hypothetical protein PGT21_023180 [Puccinia graminis f. sp. tritici]
MEPNQPTPPKTEPTKPDEPTQQSRYPLRSTCRMEASSSLFGVHASQIAPLPNFSPLRFPEPTASDFTDQDLLQAPLSKHDESPLTSRAKRRDMDPGKGYILSQSILRPPQPFHPTRPQSSESDHKDKGSSASHGKNQTPNRPKSHPSRLLGPNLTAKSPFATRFKSPLGIAVTADESVYLTPDTSLIDENQEQPPDSEAKNHALVPHGQPMHQASDDDNIKNQIATIIPGQTHLSSEWEANLFSRYRILHSLAENLKQDLSIKDQVIQVLKADRDQANKSREEAEQKMKEMATKVQQAVLEQKQIQDQEARRIGSIVESLDAEIENLMSKASSGADPSEKKGVFSSDDLHQFQTQLKFSKVQMDQIQHVPEHLQNSFTELQSCNSQQAEKIKADEEEIAMLRQQVEQLQAQVTNGTQLPLTERSTTGRASATFRDGRAHASSQPTGASDHAPKRVQENAGVLEEEAHTAEYRAEIDSLRHELEVTKRALKSAEDGQAEALEQIRELQHKLASIQQAHRLESQAHLAKLLTQSRDEFNADRSELMIKLKASNQEVEKLRVELDRRSSPDPCKTCESKDIQTTALQAERNNLQKKLDACRALSADKEVQIVQLNKTLKALKDDIMGLNIALQAKQQENSYLKRDRHVREAGLTSSSSLATSTRTTTSNRASICLGSRPRTHTTDQGTMVSMYEDQSGQTVRRAAESHHHSRKPVPENRALLSSITNRHSRPPALISSIPSSADSLSVASSDRTLRNPPIPKQPSSSSASTTTDQRLLSSSQQNQFVADDGLVPSFHHHHSHSHPSKFANLGNKTPSFIFAKHNHHHLTNHPSSNSNNH